MAKVGTGLIIADLISVIWLGSAGFFPLTILGVTWTASAIVPIVVFDALLALLLLHFGWNVKLPVRSPGERGLLLIAGGVFAIVSVLHLLRLAFGWSVVLGPFIVPAALSWLGFLIAAYLSYSCLHFARRVK